MAFRGHYEHSLDAKNRLSIPARFRAEFAAGLVLARDPDGCITLRTTAEHEDAFERALAGKNPLGADYKNTMRYFNSNAFDTELDGSGRVTIKQSLLTHAGIERDVVIAGVGSYLEVWGAGRFEEVQASIAASIGEVTESLGDPS